MESKGCGHWGCGHWGCGSCDRWGCISHLVRQIKVEKIGICSDDDDDVEFDTGLSLSITYGSPSSFFRNTNSEVGRDFGHTITSDYPRISHARYIWNQFHLIYQPLLEDLPRTFQYSWGLALLTCLYRGLCHATIISDQKEIE
ncbi:hypothetical protein Lal_00021390 [Lupinus albus]|nr:hypothetical protein Lal_00021390 [Lupinus albus]